MMLTLMPDKPIECGSSERDKESPGNFVLFDARNRDRVRRFAPYAGGITEEKFGTQLGSPSIRSDC